MYIFQNVLNIVPEYVQNPDPQQKNETVYRPNIFLKVCARRQGTGCILFTHLTI